MTTVKDLLDKTDHEAITEAYECHYRDDPEEIEALLDLLTALSNLEPDEKGAETKCCVTKSRKYGPDVYGLKAGQDMAYAIEFTPWAEWMAMEVDSPADMEPPEVCAHILWEMTWMGWDEDAIQGKLADIAGSVEEIKEKLDE